MSTEIQVFNGDQGFTQEQYDLLNKAMDVSLIKHRQGGGGQQLAYIKGKTAIDTANRIFGHGRWGYKILHRALERTTDADGRTTSEFYTADIELYVVGNPFPFPGDGVGIVIPPKKGSIAEAHEKARKEAVTDALKRALRHYGSQFANDLYDEDALVDVGDGVLDKVKNVHPKQSQNGNQQNQGRRTVDSQPPDPTVKASTPALYDAASKLKKRAIEQRIITNDEEWTAMLDYLEIKEFTSGADLAKINSKIAETLKARLGAQAS